MLSKKEILDFLEKSSAGLMKVDQQVKFLADFTPEKSDAETVKIFVDFMFGKMTGQLKISAAIDVCGTGGSGLSRINTSTISAFILAELGVGVAKHGNKAASGRFGSFDLLENLGVDVMKSPKELEAIYKKTGLAFIFARNFHPAMKHFVEARVKFGKPTIFNILGPLLNPANPMKQIIGTSFKNQMQLIAEVCKLLGKEHVIVVRGRDGLDEVTLSDRTDVVELKNGKILEYIIGPKDFGIEKANLAEISAKNSKENIEIAKLILEANCKTRHADLVFMNTALALKLAGKVDDLKEGYGMAKSVVGIGRLEGYKGNILGEIAASKILRRSGRSFKEALSKAYGFALIAEIKKTSPSKGRIFRGKFDVAKTARIYKENGASAISVLTDEKYFGGSFEYLGKVKQACSLPLLCKDFIVHEYQIYKAREYGADAVLLIANLLDVERIKKFLKIIKGLGMDSLVEVHDEKDLKKALQAGAEIIGINSRNLKTFKIDLNVFKRLIGKIPKGKIIVAESGIESKNDLKMLDKRVDAILVGTSIMQAKNMAAKVRELTSKI